MIDNPTTANHSPLQDRPGQLDIAESLRTAGVAPQRMMDLEHGKTLAQWQNRQGEVRYERPRHHALSIYIDKGQQAQRMVNGKAVSRGFPGAVCLFPAGSRSIWQIGGQFEFFHFYFNDVDVARCASQTWDSDPDKIQLNECYHREDPILAQAGKLLVLSDWQAPGQAMAMDHLAQWLLLQVVSRHASGTKAPPAVTGQLSHQYRRLLQERIHAELDQPLTLSEMAGWVNLSPYHFARLFRATFGCAPYQYVQEQRLIRARDLMRQSTTKITAIALACGFNDASQFSKAFRARFGVTPSEYRSGAHSSKNR